MGTPDAHGWREREALVAPIADPARRRPRAGAAPSASSPPRPTPIRPAAPAGRLLGARVLAYHGADLIHPVAVAMEADDGTGDPIRRAFHVHPTLGEVVRSAVERSQPG